MAASAARDLYSGRGSAVYGNLAYDLDREVPMRRPRRTAEQPAVREAAAPKVRSVSSVQVREKQSVSPMAVIGILGIIALAVLVLLSYVQLTELSAGTVKLQTQLKTLQTQSVTLTAEYEKIYDLATVKEAAEAAGMSKPSSSQIYYIDLSDGDNAVVYQQADSEILSRLLTSLNHGIYTMVEYFD